MLAICTGELTAKDSNSKIRRTSSISKNFFRGSKRESGSFQEICFFTCKIFTCVFLRNINSRHDTAIRHLHYSKFFKLGFTPCKAEKPLRGMKLQGKETKKIKGYKKPV